MEKYNDLNSHQNELLRQVREAGSNKEQVLIEDGTMSAFNLNNDSEVPVNRERK